MKYYVYITGNSKRDQFYIDFTSDLNTRIKEHRVGMAGPSYKAICDELLYYEEFDDLVSAKSRTFQLRHWKFLWLKSLINRKNPDMGASHKAPAARGGKA